MNPTSIPTLEELAAHPERASGLTSVVVRALAWKCIAALTALNVASNGAPEPSTPLREDRERLLTVPEVARLIGMSTSWVEKHTADLPPRVSVAGNPRWRKSDLDRWIRNRPEYGALSNDLDRSVR